MFNRKGQSILEYTVIIIIILGVMITMKDYVKRGIQGRWKSSTDDFGEQYDPQFVNSDINYATQINSESIVNVTNGQYTGGFQQEQGQWSSRMDTANTWESKSGYTQVGN